MTRPAVNKKYKLCDECNYKRLHEGKSRGEILLTKQKPKKYVVLRGRSKKGEEKEKKTQGAKLRSIERRGDACEGCGTHDALTNSHILSVKQRDDLRDDETNIQPLCMSCHIRWESWSVEEMIKLLCFEDNMKYIEQKDEGKFWRYMYKVIDYLKKESTNATVLENIKQMYFYNLIKTEVQK